MVYLKIEVPLLDSQLENEKDSNELKFKINNLKLDTYDDNTLLNVSVLEIEIINKEENFKYEKKLIVQFLKEKNIFYKNII